MERLDKLTRAINSVDTESMTVRVEGTFLHEEIARFLAERVLKK